MCPFIISTFAAKPTNLSVYANARNVVTIGPTIVIITPVNKQEEPRSPLFLTSCMPCLASFFELLINQLAIFENENYNL